MKFSITLIVTSLIYFSNASAQLRTDSIKVRSNCEHCVERVEGISNSLAGVTSAKLSTAKEQLIVTYDSKQITNLTIQQAIANVGHDTKDVRATDKAYKSLPACCKYERDVAASPKNKMTTINFAIEGMTCDLGCAKGIESALYKEKGVKFSEVNFETKKTKVVFDSAKITQEKLIFIVENFKPENGELNNYKVIILD